MPKSTPKSLWKEVQRNILNTNNFGVKKIVKMVKKRNNDIKERNIKEIPLIIFNNQSLLNAVSKRSQLILHLLSFLLDCGFHFIDFGERGVPTYGLDAAKFNPIVIILDEVWPHCYLL